MPLKPELLDYEGTQILFIGEGVGAGLGRAVEESSKDKKDDAKEKPEEELMKLEEEVRSSQMSFSDYHADLRTRITIASNLSRKMILSLQIWA